MFKHVFGRLSFLIFNFYLLFFIRCCPKNIKLSFNMLSFSNNNSFSEEHNSGLLNSNDNINIQNLLLCDDQIDNNVILKSNSKSPAIFFKNYNLSEIDYPISNSNFKHGKKNSSLSSINISDNNMFLKSINFSNNKFDDSNYNNKFSKKQSMFKFMSSSSIYRDIDSCSPGLSYDDNPSLVTSNNEINRKFNVWDLLSCKCNVSIFCKCCLCS